MSWIRRAWRYSRTIFLNVVSGVAMVLAALIPLMLGMDWKTVMSPEAAFYMVFAVNVLNVVLRILTTGPIGDRESE